eukprot:g14029.t1 g14029   contig9:996386-1002752(-)
MEYSSMRRTQTQLPGVRSSNQSDTDDEENHSVFDFPQSYEDENDRLRIKSKKNRSNSKHHSNHHNGKGRDVSAVSDHPYPESISIQVTADSPGSSDKHEMRSPTGSPGERGSSARKSKEDRQISSPYRAKHGSDRTSDNHGKQHDDDSNNVSDLYKHHQQGQTHFLRNQLSEAVNAYSRAIKYGLEDLKHRKDMMSRIGNIREGNLGANDEVFMELGKTIAMVHFDMGKALEVCGKYSEACDEYMSGIGILQNTCNKKKNDKDVKEARQNVKRMESAFSVETERKGLLRYVEGAMKKVESADDKEAARKNAIATIKRLIRTERECLGEQSYAVSKLKLKLAKLKCECGDIEGGIHDAESAVSNLKILLGRKHSLVGSSCLFVATAYESQASSLMSISGVTHDVKTMMNRSLEMYADALETFKFKYDDVTNHKPQPDVGDVLHKIGNLYSKKKSHASAVDSYRRSLEAYGVVWNDCDGDSSNQGFHPDAAIVWYDLAQLHLEAKEYHDALHACNKSIEILNKLATSAYKGGGNDKLESLMVRNLQAIGSAYEGLKRHDEATRSYQEALFQFKIVHSNTSKSAMNRNSSRRGTMELSAMDESRILKLIGMSQLRQGKAEDAKTSLIDALRVLRSSDNESSPDLPALLCDIGMLHIKCEEYSDAMKVLRSCMKLYADRGVSDYSSEVEKARELFKKAQDGAGSELASKSGHGQLQTLLEELTVVNGGSPKDQVSAMNTLTVELDAAKKEVAILKESQAKNALQLEEAEHSARQLRLRVKEVESERDQEKKERVYAATAHRKEIETAVARTKCDYEAEIDALRKELNVSETSYQEILRAIDDEKDQLKTNHESEIQALQQENDRLQELLGGQSFAVAKRESNLKEQEAAMLKSTNRTLQSEKEALSTEVLTLKAKVASLVSERVASKRGSDGPLYGSADRLKKLEFELQSERSRRSILEASLQKEYEKPMGMGMGPMGFHPMYGYPMSQMNYGFDKNVKSLEIDVAAERANKELLETMLGELEQEMDKLRSLADAREEELTDITAQLQQKEDAINRLAPIAEQYDGAVAELSDLKLDLSLAMEEKSRLMDAYDAEHGSLIKTKEELATERRSANKVKAELMKEKENIRCKSVEYDNLAKEYKEAVDLFESEVGKARTTQNDVESSYKAEIDRLESELSVVLVAKTKEKNQMKQILGELEDVYEQKEVFEADAQKLRVIVDNANKDLAQAREKVQAMEAKLLDLEDTNNNAEDRLSELEDKLVEEQNKCSDLEHVLNEINTKLSDAEATIQDLEGRLAETTQSVDDHTQRETELKSQCDEVLSSVMHQLVAMISSVSSLDVLSEEFDPSATLESKKNRISSLMQSIRDYFDSQVSASEKTNWNLSNALTELDTLDAKHKALKAELAETIPQVEYDELLEQHDSLAAEKEQLEKRVISAETQAKKLQSDIKSIKDVEEQRDLFQSRLKEAVDDLEELEFERDELREELDRAYDEGVKLEESLQTKILGLEQDNARLQEMDGFSLEQDAIAWEKENKLKRLEEELKAAQVELSALKSAPGTGGGARRNNRSLSLDESDLCPDIPPSNVDIEEELASLRSVVRALEEQNVKLCEKLADSQLDCLVSSSKLTQETSCQTEAIHGENEMDALKTRLSDLINQNDSLSLELAKVKLEGHSEDEGGDDKVELHRERNALLEEVSFLEDKVQSLQAYNEELSARLDVSPSDDARSVVSPASARVALSVDALLDDISALNEQIRILEQSNSILSAQLKESNEARQDDYEIISSLRNALDEKEMHRQQDLHNALNEQDERHHAALETMESQVDHLKECNAVMGHELNKLRIKTEEAESMSMLKIDLQNALNDCEESEIRHKQELATVNVEFHNALNSLASLQKENQRLKLDIQSLSSIGGGDDDEAYYQKELSAAHSRFVSMENSLSERIARLEKEKEKLVLTHTDEMTKKDSAFEKIKVELSAWKLEMQNALNDIEGLKKERDEWKTQVQLYMTSLEAAHMAKAKLEEKLNLLGVTN